MSNSKCEFTNLHVDCLKEVISLISAYDMGRLWMAGNIKLRKLLSEGGAVRNFDFSFEACFPVLWPRLIDSLHQLVDISIEISTRTDCAHLEIDFASFPRQLEHLNLLVSAPSFSFDVNLWSKVKAFPHLQTLWLQGEVSDEMEEVDLSEMSNLVDFGCSFTCRSKHIFFSKLGLPAFLSRLSVSVSHKNLDAFLPSLPASLTSLALYLETFGDLWCLLPRNLLYLRLELPSHETPNVEDFAGLPPHLQTFITTVPKLTPKMIRQLPPSLTNLHCYGGELQGDIAEMYSLLPEHLVDFGGLLSVPTLSPALAKALPRSYRGLLEGPEPGALAHVPSHVTTLESVAHDFSQLARFTHLQCLSCIDFDLEWLPTLPPSLQTLILEISQTAPTNFTIPQIVQLPPSLTNLQVEAYTIDSKAFQYLPRSITSLRFAIHFGGWETNDQLFQNEGINPKIANDEFGKTTKLADSGHLPPGLTSLTLCQPQEGLPMVRPINVQQEWWVSHIAGLTNLWSLSILSERYTFHNAKWLILNLPKRLNDLNWDCQENDLENEDLLNILPRYLCCFNVANSPRLSLQKGALGLPTTLDYMAHLYVCPKPPPPPPRNQPDWLQFLLFPFKLPQILWSLLRG